MGTNSKYSSRDLRRLRRLQAEKPLDAAILAPTVQRALYEIASRTQHLNWMLGGDLAAQCYHESRVVLAMDVVVPTEMDKRDFLKSCENIIEKKADGSIVFKQSENPSKKYLISWKGTGQGTRDVA